MEKQDIGNTAREAMSKTIKFINKFFKYANKKDVENVHSQILLTERQEKIFDMFYIKKLSIDFIADSLFISIMTVNNELKTIRKKLMSILEEF